MRPRCRQQCRNAENKQPQNIGHDASVNTSVHAFSWLPYKRSPDCRCGISSCCLHPLIWLDHAVFRCLSGLLSTWDALAEAGLSAAADADGTSGGSGSSCTRQSRCRCSDRVLTWRSPCPKRNNDSILLIGFFTTVSSVATGNSQVVWKEGFLKRKGVPGTRPLENSRSSKQTLI